MQAKLLHLAPYIGGAGLLLCGIYHFLTGDPSKACGDLAAAGGLVGLKLHIETNGNGNGSAGESPNHGRSH